MIRIPKLRINYKLILLSGCCLIFFLTIVMGASLLFMSVLMLWFLLVIIALNDWKNNIAFVCFLCSFFVFLLGREACYYYLSLEIPYRFLFSENTFAYIAVLLALTGVGIGNYIDIFPKNAALHRKKTRFLHDVSSGNAGKITKYAFFICYIFSMIDISYQIILVRRVGYVSSYTAEAASVGAPGIVVYMGALTTIMFFLFLGTYPEKRIAMMPMALYELYGILMLLTGKRYPFVAISMMILIYMVIRNKTEEGWINKKMMYLIILSIPFLLVFLAVYDAVRVGGTFNFSGIGNTIVAFFRDQGGSINVLKRVKYHEEELRDMSFCSLHNCRSVLFENLLMRKLTGVQVFTGNSVENAMYGHSLSHRLSYYAYGSAYLSGRGVGSCYIAELYHDFGYIGIFAGSVFYGFILHSVNYMTFHSYIRDGVLLAVVYYLLLAPRGDFDGFVGDICSIYSLLGIAVIFIVISLLNRRKSDSSEQKI